MTPEMLQFQRLFQREFPLLDLLARELGDRPPGQGLAPSYANPQPLPPNWREVAARVQSAWAQAGPPEPPQPSWRQQLADSTPAPLNENFPSSYQAAPPADRAAGWRERMFDMPPFHERAVTHMLAHPGMSYEAAHSHVSGQAGKR